MVLSLFPAENGVASIPLVSEVSLKWDTGGR